MLKKRKSAFDIVNTSIVVAMTLVFLYPLYFCIVASFSSPTEVSAGNTLLFVKDFTLDNYIYAFRESSLWVGYRNTIFYTLFGTLYNLIMTIPAAYALSKRDLPMRNGISWYFFISM